MLNNLPLKTYTDGLINLNIESISMVATDVIAQHTIFLNIIYKIQLLYSINISTPFHPMTFLSLIVSKGPEACLQKKKITLWEKSVTVGTQPF